MARKIMVFDERIDNYYEKIFEIQSKVSLCFYCYKVKEIKYKIYNHAFTDTLQMCNDCASIYYGGVLPYGGNEMIQHDSLLDYLNEIDPIDVF